jgi:hypothetical protein
MTSIETAQTKVAKKKSRFITFSLRINLVLAFLRPELSNLPRLKNGNVCSLGSSKHGRGRKHDGQTN